MSRLLFPFEATSAHRSEARMPSYVLYSGILNIGSVCRPFCAIRQPKEGDGGH